MTVEKVLGGTINHREGESASKVLSGANTTEVLKLDDIVKSWGCEYELIERGKDWAIYHNIDKRVKNSYIGFKMNYRPLKLEQIEQGLDKKYIKREAFPDDSAFGKTAWDCPTREMAKKYVEGLFVEVSNPIIKDGCLLLGERIKTNGYIYSLVKREGNIAIYKQGMTPFYEVIRIKVKTVNELLKSGKKYKDCDTFEAYPASEEWGRNGWTFNSIEKAEKKYRSLLGV